MADDDQTILLPVTKQDWSDFCEIMRTLTWGRHPDSQMWHKMRQRIEKRMMVEVTHSDPE